MCLRNWCALENNYTCCIPSGKVIWKLKHSRKLFFPYFLLELEEMSRYACSLLQLIGGGILLKFVDVFQFLNDLLEEMSSYWVCKLFVDKVQRGPEL